MSLRPLTGQCLVELLPPEATSFGGLHLPDIAANRIPNEKERPAYARVLGLGPWRKTRQGFSVLPDFKPGDKVIVSFYSGHKLTYGVSDKLKLVDVRDVLAKVEGGEVRHNDGDSSDNVIPGGESHPGNQHALNFAGSST